MKILGDRITLDAPDAELERMLDSQHERTGPLEWRVRPPRARGAGDLVKKVTDALGIPTCGGCEERRKWLNEHFPLGGGPT